MLYTFNPFHDTSLFQLSLNSSICLGRGNLLNYLFVCAFVVRIFIIFLVMCLAPSGCIERNIVYVAPEMFYKGWDCSKVSANINGLSPKWNRSRGVSYR